MKKWINRIVCALLCLAMLMTWAPSTGLSALAATTGLANRVSDASTIDDWKTYFSADNTVNAGAVWTDKSVLTEAWSNISLTNPEASLWL